MRWSRSLTASARSGQQENIPDEDRGDDHLPAGVPHALSAIAKFRMSLVMIKE
jgi:hypothetical protein